MASHRRAPHHSARRTTWRVLLGILTAANLALGVTVLATGPEAAGALPTGTAVGPIALVGAGPPVTAAP